MARICLCLTGKTLARDLAILHKYRNYADLAELRVDCLEPDERFLIRRFPEQAGIPVILTIRRDVDGGYFKGGEGSRITLLSKGLAFAEVDRRKNFAYVDLEEDLQVPSLEEAARTFGTRIIRSCHNIHGMEEDLNRKLRELRRVGDEIVKVAVSPHTLADTARIFEAAEADRGMDRILLGMGRFGTITRLLAEWLGSFLSYASPLGEADLPAGAPGQLDPQELAELYRFRRINTRTLIYGVLGHPLRATSSPAFFNQVFREENTDAVYIPFPADSLESFLALAEKLNIQGMSVTVPYKEAILPRLAGRSAEVDAVGACNTIIRSGGGWMGYNTDSKGFSDSLVEFTGKKDLRGKRIAIIGAGGAARAVAAAIYRLKGKALILNRTAARARQLASYYHFEWGDLDGDGAGITGQYNDIIIQTTSVGMEPDIEADPLPDYPFSGTELVLDLVYKPEKTRLLQRAEAAGCRIRNGYDMLIRQAQYQYGFFMDREFPAPLMSRIKL
ncbi:MAG: type I 3-dehydroquinate dehydratase [Treponema sp.]|jgi:3-dehydroquinate dehydratase/shikimate dehydrogenase|nr:type I 3-dehydroquinate dehydratase [Treponema sp.]